MPLSPYSGPDQAARVRVHSPVPTQERERPGSVLWNRSSHYGHSGLGVFPVTSGTFRDSPPDLRHPCVRSFQDPPPRWEERLPGGGLSVDRISTSLPGSDRHESPSGPTPLPVMASRGCTGVLGWVPGRNVRETRDHWCRRGDRRPGVGRGERCRRWD